MLAITRDPILMRIGWRHWLPADPRNWQIGILSLLLGYGIVRLDFDVGLPQLLAIVTTALLTQAVLGRLVRLPRFDPRSPLITSLSLCLLLRSNDPGMLALAACLAIAGKFLLRLRGRHVFNPSNFGIVAMLALFGDQAWVSPAQWGSGTWFAFLLLCLGGMVLYRAERGDVTLAFLLAYAALVFGRGLWLGDPAAIPAQQLCNGALLIFAFFMISDPKTTPDSRAGRVLFALLVTLGAGVVQFVLYRQNGLLWSLALFAMTVPLINLLLPGEPHRQRKIKIHRGVAHV